MKIFLIISMAVMTTPVHTEGLKIEMPNIKMCKALVSKVSFDGLGGTAYCEVDK